MSAPRRTLVTAIICLVAPAIAAADGNISVNYFEPLQKQQFLRKDASGSLKPGSSQPMVLAFDALGTSFRVDLEPNTSFLSQAAISSLPAGVSIYRGKLVGNPDSWARIVTYEDTPRGLIWDGNDLYAIEAPGDSLLATDAPVIYRLADTYVEAGTMSCGATPLYGSGNDVFAKLAGDLSQTVQQGPGAVTEIQVGAVGDFEFTSAQGGDAAAATAIATRLNDVDGIFSQAIGVQISVPLIETFSDAADPFTDVTVPADFLDEVAQYRQGSSGQRQLGLTHLYTGRDLDGTTVGIAYTDVLCRTNVGAGLSEGNGSPAFDALITAHEIGHNFGAPHDGVPGACESEPMTYLMAPTLNGSNEFSQCSKDIMSANAAQASCIQALPTVDIVPSMTGLPSSVLLGTSNQLTVNVDNRGGSAASDVTVSISLPAQVAYESAEPSAGSCMSGAGVVSCSFGDIPGLSGRTVLLTTTAAAVGSGSFDAATTALFDERLDNNSASASLTVDPAVDLVIQALPSLSIDLDASGTINTVVENKATIAATGVALSIVLGDGLIVNGATWSAGTCDIAGQNIDCQAQMLDAGASSALIVNVTGDTVGAKAVSATISANEPDAAQADNSVSGTVTVVDPTKVNDSGAGGTGLPLIGFLLLTLARRTRRRQFREQG